VFIVAIILFLDFQEAASRETTHNDTSHSTHASLREKIWGKTRLEPWFVIRPVYRRGLVFG